MSPASEIRFIVQRELRKNFRSIKGIVLLAITILGGSGIALLIAKYNEYVREKVPNLTPEHVHELREEAITKFYGDADMGRSLADSPEVLFGLLKLTIWLTPLLIALMGFDAIAPDLQHRAVRYWSLRTRRWSYFVGKWAGLWATVSAVTFVMDAIVWVFCIARGEATAATTLGWGLRFWVISLPMSAAWCGIATLFSSLFRSPIVALLTTFLAFFALWIFYAVALYFDAGSLMYLYPNHYDHLLLHPRVHRLGTGLLATFAMTGVYLGAGSVLFARRDV